MSLSVPNATGRYIPPFLQVSVHAPRRIYKRNLFSRYSNYKEVNCYICEYFIVQSALSIIVWCVSNPFWSLTDFVLTDFVLLFLFSLLDGF